MTKTSTTEVPENSTPALNLNELYKKLSKNIHYLELKQYYSTNSTWEIIGQARSEVQHTNFIRWVLVPDDTGLKSNKSRFTTSISHHLNDFQPVILFLKSLLWTLERKLIDDDTCTSIKFEDVEPNFQINRNNNLECQFNSIKKACSIHATITSVTIDKNLSMKCDEELLKKLITENLIPLNREINNNDGKTDSNSKFAIPDIVMYVHYQLVDGKKFTLPILIENKINALETTKVVKVKENENVYIGQTVYYHELFNKEYFDGLKNKDEIIENPVYIYWTTKSDVELQDKEHKEPEDFDYKNGYCQSQDYIYYNYQTFISKVLEKLPNMDLTSTAIVQEYIRTCAYTNYAKNTNSKDSIIAHPMLTYNHCWELFKNEEIRTAILGVKASDYFKKPDPILYIILRNWKESYRIKNSHQYDNVYESVISKYGEVEGTLSDSKKSFFIGKDRNLQYTKFIDKICEALIEKPESRFKVLVGDNVTKIVVTNDGGKKVEKNGADITENKQEIKKYFDFSTRNYRHVGKEKDGNIKFNNNSKDVIKNTGDSKCAELEWKNGSDDKTYVYVGTYYFVAGTFKENEICKILDQYKAVYPEVEIGYEDKTNDTNYVYEKEGGFIQES